MKKDLCLTIKCTSSCTFNVQIRKRPVLELEIDDIEEMDATIIILEKNCLQMSGIIPKLQLDDLFLWMSVHLQSLCIVQISST